MKLAGAIDHCSMTVLDSRGSVTSGRATVHRHGTGFYLQGELGSGFKLAIDADSASRCYEDGGRDCDVCEPIALRRERYIVKRVCATAAPNGPYVATLYESGESTGEDAMGELASGPVQSGLHAELVVSLKIGPSAQYTY